MFICHVSVFFGGVSIQICGLFFDRVVCSLIIFSFKSSLYILDNSPLSDMFCKHFSPSLWFAFHRANVFNLNKSNLSIFSFTDRVLGVVPKNVIAKPKVSYFFSYLIF